MFFADAIKCFDKLWLKDCLLEMYNIGYDSNTLNILYEMSKETDIIIRNQQETHNIQAKKLVKHPSCAVQKHLQLTQLEKK